MQPGKASSTRRGATGRGLSVPPKKNRPLGFVHKASSLSLKACLAHLYRSAVAPFDRPDESLIANGRMAPCQTDAPCTHAPVCTYAYAEAYDDT